MTSRLRFRPFSSRSLLIGAVVTVPPLYLTYREIVRLEAKYPPSSVETTSTFAFRSPSSPKTHHTPYADVYTARVPVRGLHPAAQRAQSLEEAWALTFLESPMLKTEGRLIGLVTGRTNSPGDCGEDGFRLGQILLNGIFEIVRAPTKGAPLLVSWQMPSGPITAFRWASGWGYPWRLMSGGRHELAVGSDVDADGMVEVRFSAAHDYEWVEEEGSSTERQKTVPEWVKRCHRAYARWLLDERAEAVRRRATMENDAGDGKV